VSYYLVVCCHDGVCLERIMLLDSQWYMMKLVYPFEIYSVWRISVMHVLSHPHRKDFVCYYLAWKSSAIVWFLEMMGKEW